MPKNSRSVLALPSVRWCYLLQVLFLFLFVIMTKNSYANEWVYTVKAGDNIRDISKTFLIDKRYWRELQEINNITQTENMPAGMKLWIPFAWTRVNPAKTTIKNVTSHVFVIRAGIMQKVTEETNLQAGDEIISKENSSLTLVFGDNSRLILHPQSKLKLLSVESYGNNDVFNTELKLQRGRIENFVDPDKKSESRFKIDTPSASAAVRGTVYRLAVTEQGKTIAEVLEGEVVVTSDVGKTNVFAGYGVITTHADKTHTSPKALLPAPNLSGFPRVFKQLPLRLELPQIEGAYSYRVQISRDPDFHSIIFHETFSVNSVIISKLINGKYFLKISGIDVNGLEGISNVHSFELNEQPQATSLKKASVSKGFDTVNKQNARLESRSNFVNHVQILKQDRFTCQPVDNVKPTMCGTLRIGSDKVKGLGSNRQYTGSPKNHLPLWCLNKIIAPPVRNSRG